MNTKSIMSRKRQRKGSHTANKTSRRVAFFQQCMELACQSQLIQLFIRTIGGLAVLMRSRTHTHIFSRISGSNRKSLCHAISSKKSVFVTIFAKYWHCLCIQNLQQNRDPDTQSFNLLYIFFRIRSRKSKIAKFNHRFKETERPDQISPRVVPFNRPRLGHSWLQVFKFLLF